jgi:hypothetical protein
MSIRSTFARFDSRELFEADLFKLLELDGVLLKLVASTTGSLCAFEFTLPPSNPRAQAQFVDAVGRFKKRSLNLQMAVGCCPPARGCAP